MSEAIKIVSETVCGRQISDLPSRPTQSRFGAEMKHLSRVQINEKLENASNTTLKYDATTKGRHGHLVECEISTGNETYLLGVHEEAGGTADDYIGAIKDMSESTGGNILQGVVNTMTDRASVNRKVDDKLGEELNKPLHSYRCAMHPLDSLAKACDKCLKGIEVTEEFQAHGLYRHRGESTVTCLVRKCCSLFNNDATGCRHELTSYLKSQKCPVTSLPRWVGNRFNILFDCCQILIIMAPFITQYFNKVTKPSNDLQATVHRYLQSPFLFTSIKCLGIIGSYLTKPWFVMLASVSTIMETNSYFQSAAAQLKKWEVDPSLLFQPHSMSAFEGIDAKVDPSLLPTTPEEQANMEACLAKLLQSCNDVFCRQLHDHLEGGIYYMPDPEVIDAASSCSATNISGERQFGKVDYVIRKAPNITVGKLEAKVMFSSNDTASWLADQPAEKKQEHIKNAIRKGSHVRQQDKCKKEKLMKAFQEKNNLRKIQRSLKEQQNREKLELLTENVIKDGIFDSTDDINLNDMNKTSAKQILKTQIQFRRLLQTSPHKAALSKGTVEDLQRIFNDEINNEMNEKYASIPIVIKNPASLVNKTLEQKWEDEDGFEIWWEGKVLAIKDKELCIKYTNSPDTCYLTVTAGSFFFCGHNGQCTSWSN